MIRLLKSYTADQRAIDLHLVDGNGVIGTATLGLPAHDEDVNDALDTLQRQASFHDIRINGRQRLALFQSIEAGVAA